MQALALFRGARGLSLARRCLIPQRSRLLCGRAVPVARASHRKWCSSRLEWPLRREMSSSSLAATATAASRFASSSPNSPSSSSSSPPSSLPLPLCELPATEQATAGDLLAWRGWAKELVESLGPEGHSADGGPDRRELLKELDWFLEDAVASPPWERLQREELQKTAALASSSSSSSSSSSLPAAAVSLRSSLPALSALWEARIKERLPFQYAVGIAHWRRVTLAVGSGVLCPRPETEQLVDLAAAAFREMMRRAEEEENSPSSSSSPPLSSLPWADLGTGSGAIAVGLALDALVVGSDNGDGGGRGSNGDGVAAAVSASTSSSSSSPSSSSFSSPPQPRVFAVDASPLAASWARLNVSRLNLEDRVTVLEGSWLEPVFEEREREARRTKNSSASLPPLSSKEEEGFLAGVVSNPPYIPRSQLPTLQREVRDHEPNLALDGGTGAGLDSLRPLCASAARALACGGFLALETAGKEQASEVASDLLERSGFFEDVKVHEDLFGVSRFVTATRKRREA